MSDRQSTRYLMYALFFLSGVSGLIYQIVWTRLLVLVFGNTMLATSTVLSSFMGGLAAGSYFIGRAIDRKPLSLIRLYAGLEIGIGLYALLFPLLLSAATPLYAGLYGAVEGNIVLLNLARFAVCFVLIGIPTFLMGATLPVLLKRFSRGAGALGRQTGFFYGLNTAGAVVGTVACGYVLMRLLGMRGTTWVAVAINLGVGVAAWILSRQTAADADESASPQESAEHAQVSAEPLPGPKISALTRRMVLVGIGISGFCALAYEVFWTRMLNLFLHNNIYSFTAILATFLVGIAVGSLIYARFLAHRSNQVSWFVGLEIGIGLISYATPFIFSLLHGTLFKHFSEALTLAKTAVIMIGPTIMMGIAVPMAVQICQRGERREGTSVGVVYAVNTLGAILGAFAAGFILLPYVGLHLGVIIVAGLNILAGFLPLIARARAHRRFAWSATFAGLMIALLLPAPKDLFRGLFERQHPSADILHYKEGKIANVLVYDFTKNGYKDLHLNAVEEASSRLWHVQLFKMLGILPVMLHDDPDNAVMIAFGAGMSAGACVNYVDEFECVDLNPDIEGVANVFARENLDVYNNPKFNQVVNDGRNALLLSDKKYSLIISDATNPKMFDSWTLYSQEFYQLVKERLKPDGIFCQWALMPLPGDSIKVLLNTFRSVFPHMSFWAIYGSSQVLMLGTPERLEIDYEELKTRLEPILEESGLEEFGVDSVEKFLSFFLLGEDHINEMIDGFTAINTDDLPHVQFRVDQDDAGIDDSLDLVRYQESILPYLTNTGGAPDIEHKMRDYEAISRRLNIGFLTGQSMRFQEAEVIDFNHGMNDPNVRGMLHHGPEKRRYFEQRAKDHPDDFNARNWVAFIEWRDGNLDEAERQFREIVEQKPDFAVAKLNLARVLIDKGAYDDAVARLVEVRAANPTRTTRSTVATQLNIIYLLRKLEQDPQSRELQRALAVAFYNDGQLLRSIQAYRSAARIEPIDPRVLFNLARVLESHELVGATASTYAQLAALAPDDEMIRARAQEFAALAADPAAQRSWMNARLQYSPAETAADQHPQSCDRALAAWNSAEFDGSVNRDALHLAASLYEESAASKPDDLHAYVDAATIYESLEEFSRAAELWRRVGELAPDAPAPSSQQRRLELLAEVDAGRLEGSAAAAAFAEISGFFRANGDLESAIEYARRSLETDPQQPATRQMLAETLRHMGLQDQAAAIEVPALESSTRSRVRD